MDICNLLMKQFKYEIDFSTNISMQRLDQYIASWPLRFCKAIHYLKQHPNSIYSIHLPNRDGKLTLSLSKKGDELEKKLSEIQILKIYNVIKNFDENDINGFKKVLFQMVDIKNQKKFNEIN